MIYRSIAVTAVFAYTLIGCYESHSEAMKREFVQVAKSAKNANMLQKFDQDLNEVARRLRDVGIDLPKGSANDAQVASRAVDALLAYTEISQVDKQIRDLLISYTASARSMYSSHTSLFDLAVNNLETSLVKEKDPKSLALPNYAVYDFVRAVFHILTDEYFHIDSSSEITKALECSSGVVASCVGPSNTLNREVLYVMGAVTLAFNQDDVSDDLPTQLQKSLFAPIYVFLNHKSIDYGMREWIVKVAVAFAKMLTTAPRDPREMAEHLNDAFSQIQLSQADKVMIQRISGNLEFIGRRLLPRGLSFLPAQAHVRLSVPMNTVF